MALFTVGAAVVGAGAQLYMANRQKKQANNLKKSTYVPESLLDKERIERGKIGRNQTKRQARTRNKIKESSAQSINMAKKIGGTSTELLHHAGLTAETEKNAILKNEMVAEAEKEKYTDDYKRTLDQKAGLEEENQKRYEAGVSELKGASANNVYNAITQIGGAAAFLEGQNAEEKRFNKYLEAFGSSGSSGSSNAGGSGGGSPSSSPSRLNYDVGFGNGANVGIGNNVPSQKTMADYIFPKLGLSNKYPYRTMGGVY